MKSLIKVLSAVVGTVAIFFAFPLISNAGTVQDYENNTFTIPDDMESGTFYTVDSESDLAIHAPDIYFIDGDGSRVTSYSSLEPEICVFGPCENGSYKSYSYKVYFSLDKNLENAEYYRSGGIYVRYVSPCGYGYVTSFSDTYCRAGRYWIVFYDEMDNRKQVGVACIDLTPVEGVDGILGDNIGYHMMDRDKDGVRETAYIFGSGEMYDFETSPFADKNVTDVLMARYIKSIGKNTFAGCTNLKTVKPYNTSSGSVEHIGENAFNGCYVLEDVYSVCWYSRTIGAGAFYCCFNLNKFPASQYLTSIGDNAFAYCVALTDVTLYTPLKTLGINAFDNCTALESISVPLYLINVLGSSFDPYINIINIQNLSGWTLINNHWCYISEEGKYTFGWRNENSTWYYLDSSGRMVTGWYTIKGVDYYFASSGKMVIGWKSIDGEWYYFETSGKFLYDTWKLIGGKWYFFDDDGHMVTGWQNINRQWYYFNASGNMVSGWKKIGGDWYYFEASGKMVTGWLEISGKWYYFYGSGAMAHDTTIGSYVLDSNGVWVK